MKKIKLFPVSGFRILTVPSSLLIICLSSNSTFSPESVVTISFVNLYPGFAKVAVKEY
jgi:hypothetical protein